jgi:hypothetical protein
LDFICKSPTPTPCGSQVVGMLECLHQEEPEYAGWILHFSKTGLTGAPCLHCKDNENTADPYQG